jgi:serine/threonine protein kinase
MTYKGTYSKPQNIMVSFSRNSMVDKLVLCDFGTAVSFRDHSLIQGPQTHRTPAYLAPEDDDSEYSPRKAESIVSKTLNLLF